MTSHRVDLSVVAAPTTVVEVERTFEVEPGGQVRVDDLVGVGGILSVSPPRVERLAATYLDSADLRLAAAKITLRRRTGGADAGWHLKTPAGPDARTEHRAPAGTSSRAVPASLRAIVAVHLGGRPLVPVVRLSTRRRVTTLLGADGTPLAEVAQDAVTARVSADAGGAGGPADGRTAQESTWEEVEVELLDGDRDLLDAVEEHLATAGVRRSAAPSKLARALGDRLPARPPRAASPGSVEEVGPRGTAGAVLRAHLATEVDRLRRHDPLVRADAPDAVHQMRVAARRLRSALVTYRPLLDREVTDPLREELRWLGEVLGGPRDAEVVRDHLLAALEREPTELVLGPASERVWAALDERHREASAAALRELDGERYFALLARLDALVADPPLTGRAARRAARVLPGLVARDDRRLRGLVRAARAAAADPRVPPEQRDEALHDVRKAAKRARYAAESLVPILGGDASRYAKAVAAVQEVLGEHQDGSVARTVLRELAVDAEAGVGFTFGRLHALEQARAQGTPDALRRVWARSRGRRLRRWLR